MDIKDKLYVATMASDAAEMAATYDEYNIVLGGNIPLTTAMLFKQFRPAHGHGGVEA